MAHGLVSTRPYDATALTRATKDVPSPAVFPPKPRARARADVSGLQRALINLLARSGSTFSLTSVARVRIIPAPGPCDSLVHRSAA